MTLTERIKEDLQRRIEGGQGLPADLTIASLARHYGISNTPVRLALLELVAQGVLYKGRDRRIRLTPPENLPDDTPVAESPSRVNRRTAELDRILAAEVIVMSLRGKTDYLHEEPLAERFGVSRIALGRSLRRLEGRGLLVPVPRRGWQVRAFNAAELDAYLEIREVLEIKALDLARHYLVEADLRRMLVGNVPGRIGQEPQVDNDLHRYLIDKAGNPFIRQFFERHGSYFTSLFEFAARETHFVSETARQHRDILRALLDKDWPRAQQALVQHIRDQGPIVRLLIKRLEKTQETPG